MNHREKGKPLKMDLALSGADPNDYDGLLLPGGVANPDELRTNPQPVRFVRLSSTVANPSLPEALGWTARSSATDD